jgi:hypothetical protein
VLTSVQEPDLLDPLVFVPPGSGIIIICPDPDSDPDPSIDNQRSLKKILIKTFL